MSPETARTIATIALVAICVFTAVTASIAAVRWAGNQSGRRTSRWILLALGSALLGGTLLGALIFDPRSE
jgi:hypothetical protein